MDTISPEIEQEIERRLAAGPYASVNELIIDALKALDGAHRSAHELLEKELLLGLEGEDVEMTAADWDDIEKEALSALESKKTR